MSGQRNLNGRFPNSSNDLQGPILNPIEFAFAANQTFERLHRICPDPDFRFEDFYAALSANDSEASVAGLIANIHIGLLQILSIEPVYPLTWFSCLKRHYSELFTIPSDWEYSAIGIKDRLEILDFLVDSSSTESPQGIVQCKSSVAHELKEFLTIICLNHSIVYHFSKKIQRCMPRS